MKLALALVAMLLSTQAFAGSRQNPSPLPEVSFGTEDGRLGLVTITGRQAEKIYEALDVEPCFQFGFVQVYTKRLNNVECERSFFGDNPANRAGPNHICKIEMYLR